jgi:site-specific recombinase XerD
LVARSSRAGGMIKEVKPMGYKLIGFLFYGVKMIKRAQNSLKSLVDSVDNYPGGIMVKDYLQQFYFNCQLKNLSDLTLKTYGDRLKHFFDHLSSKNISFDEITRGVIEEYILSQKGKVRDITVNGKIRTLKTFFNFLQREGMLNNGNPMTRIGFIRVEKKLRPILSLEEVQKLLKVCNRSTFTGMRNYCMLLLFWDGMIRLLELMNLRADDVDLKEGIIKIYGKGRKERFIPIGIRTTKAFHQYWFKFREKIPSLCFFCTSTGRPLERRNIERILERIGNRVGIKVTPHMLRHSAATWFISQGAPAFYLQKILGHSAITTTEIYVHLANMKDIKQVHNRYSPADSLRV